MDKEHYFQSIVRYFLRLRGAPFFLSAQELSLIEAWSKIPIPVPEVLAGIHSAYQNFRAKPGRKRRIFSLVFCRRDVEQSYAAYQNRRVGQNRRIISSGKKSMVVLQEIKDFLSDSSPAVKFLVPVFLQLERRLAQGEINEMGLEQEERNIENLVWCNAQHTEKERIKKELQQLYNLPDCRELEQLIKIKLLKEYRDRHKIPYVSLFYY